MTLFQNRTAAGMRLAAQLAPEVAQRQPIVLGLARGGVPVGLELARHLQAPLDVFVVRKLGAPSQPELALGALASGDVAVLNRELIEILQVPGDTLQRIIAAEREELERREAAYRMGAPALDIEGRTVIVADDGLATGASMRAALTALLRARPAEIIAAIPVAPPETLLAIRQLVDDVVCIATPEPFYSVGAWYADFTPVSDQELRQALAEARSWGSAPCL
ncbi:MAG: phosphoribosyltransferase [Anaerolineae bacterium]|jgi:putative phosphoribosyl transferase|nr:phosphoribosyltransferase [Chloroflexota bacterium]